MKKQLLLYVICSLLFLGANAQSVPHGMNYQATARNKSGEVLVNKTITLKVNLQSPQVAHPTIYYSEIHSIITNEFGMFTLVVGKGSIVSGSFYQIPWSSEHIWMEVDVKMENEPDFTNISSSELLAVPYAFHAGTASQISGDYNPYVIPGTVSSGNSINSGSVPATSWQVTGNSATNPPIDYIGTSDLKDLIVSTNGIERLRIYTTGNINITNSLTIGIDLTVGRDATINHNLRVKNDVVIDSNLYVRKNVYLNTSGGSTVNYGSFTVEKISPSILTGTLRVDQITNLNDSLNVNNIKPTLFTGTLRVNKETNLYNSFTVNNQSPSVLTGTLRVDSNVTFNSHLTLDNSTFNSSDSSNGALVVAGGAGIGKNLNVGGDFKVSGNTEFHGQVKINDGRPSERPDSGALVVAGGVGVGKQISVGGYAHLYDSVKVDGSTSMQKTLTVNDSANFNNKLNVTGQTTLNGDVKENGQVTIESPNLANADQSLYSSYPLQVQGSKQGMAIKVTGNKSASNNYSAFYDQTGMQGRIEGMAAGEYLQTAEWASQNQTLNDNILSSEFNVASATLSEASAIVTLAAASVSTTPCVGLGVCATIPIPSFIVAGIVAVAGATAMLVGTSIGLDNAYTAKSDFDAASSIKNGVTYESGAGDYAEYLEMINPSELMFSGDIVGLKGGKITRNTEGADKIMVLSKRPIVLGNMPKDGNENGYKKVAFLGQVPVKVLGKVNLGDYILPDGNNFGIGKAVSPSSLNSADVRNIVGVAWSSSDNETAISDVNVAVGLNVVDNQKEILELENEISDLNNQIAQSDNELAELIPGYKESINVIPNSVITKSVSSQKQINIVTPDASSIIYHYIPREEIEKGFDKMVLNMESGKQFNSTILFLKKLKSDPTFRSSTIDGICAKVSKQIIIQKDLDKKLAK